MSSALATADGAHPTSQVHDLKRDPARTVDDALVARVQGRIRDAIRATVSQGVEDLGRILLREFYGDSVEAYRSTGPRKHASLQALLRTCDSLDFPVKRTMLANALQLAAFCRQVDAGSAFLALPQSHRIELLRLRSPDRIHALASMALEEKMSMRRIREEVRKVRRKHRSSRGRKPLPPVVRAISCALRALQGEDISHVRFRPEDVSALKADQRARFLELLDALSSQVNELRRLREPGPGPTGRSGIPARS